MFRRPQLLLRFRSTFPHAVQDGRIYIERINAPFMFKLKGSAGLKSAVGRGWLSKHESGTYVQLTAPREDLLTGE
ncbi:hypothetical protein QIH92_25190 [Bradyrhizobium japonicum USDA 123]|nr:hypothetical protein [Bradyrhizobium japonicum]WLC03003.1 hypothetical protein QIH92_25190 [Bradyrhizobium japonicum USDA 123]